MQNPFGDSYTEHEQVELVKKAVNGNREALQEFIVFHRPYIYNVAWKMCHDPNDAEDLTQEVLIKVITKLGQFNFKSKVRTWLYRIVINEFLQTKRREGEKQFLTFTDYGERLDQVPDPEPQLTLEEELEQEVLSKEMQIRCMSGMIMCLSREQRLIFILGESFGIDHNLGAELFNLSPQNFRVKLHRARKELYNYMNDKCGLVNKANPCRCPKKARTLKQMGMLKEDELIFNIDTKSKVKNFVADNHAAALEGISEVYTDLFREHPVKEDFEKDNLIKELVSSESLSKYFDL